MITRNAAIGMTLIATLIWTGLSWHWYSCTLKNACQIATPKYTNIVRQPVITPMLADTQACATDYLRDSVRYGRPNDTAQVLRLQHFLNYYQNEQLVLDGTYNTDDLAAVQRFQRKHAAEILTPYGLSKANGYVHKATKAKINTIYCANHS